MAVISPFRSAVSIYWNAARPRPLELIVPFLLLLVAAGGEALTLAILIPVANAVAEGNIASLYGFWWLGWLAGIVPEDWSAGETGERRFLFLVLLIMVLARLTILVCNFLRQIYVTRRLERYRGRIGSRVFSQIMGFGHLYHVRRSPAEVEVELQWAHGGPGILTVAEDAFSLSLRIAVKITAMVALSLQLSLVFLSVILVTAFLLRWLQALLRDVSWQKAQAEQELRRETQDLLTSFPFVKVNSRESQTLGDYTRALGRVLALELEKAKLYWVRWPSAETLVLGTYIVCLAVLVLPEDGIAVGELATYAIFLLIVSQLLPDFKGVTNLYAFFAQEGPKHERVSELFSKEEKERVTSGPATLPTLEREIRVAGLNFRYGDGPSVLNDVDAVIPAGKFTGVVGESGSGKTTLAFLLARLLECPPGTILFDGQDVRGFSLESVHRQLALVGQDIWLVNRSIRENLSFGLTHAPADRDVWELLDELGLETLVRGLPEGLDTQIGPRGVRLSGGQRQRLTLAGALLKDPRILILDEPTSALDGVTERRVMEVVEERMAGATLIVVAHRLSTIQNADHILVLHAGDMVESGSWSSLAARDGTFRTLLRSQWGEAPAEAHSSLADSRWGR